MASPVEAQLILCDAAQAAAGKVHMLGAGWSITSSPTAPHAVAVLIKVPWDRANQKLPLRLQLLDADGHPVMLPGSGGTPKPLVTEAAVEVGRPAGLAHGTMLDASFALNVAPLPLAPGRYEWRMTFAGKEFAAPFTVAG
jgi:hypothetical protein